MHYQVLAQELRAKLLLAVEHLVPRGAYSVVDFPNYSNVGDSAIWLGQLRMLEMLSGQRPSYVASLSCCDFDKLAKVTGPIFISGGGNFGDLYPRHQAFREAILERFPDRPIVQLPQSIHFDDQDNTRRTRAIIAAHPNFVLCVRDLPSLQIAQSFECATVLAPDSAFFLDLGTVGRPEHEVVYLHRTDGEATGEARALPDGWLDVDWIEEPGNVYEAVRNGTAIKAVFAGPRDREALRYRIFERVAQNRLRRGVRLLSSGNVVVTDRLHAHILCTLLDIPHFTLDNSYGKVRSFINAWGTDRGSGIVVDNLDEVVGRFNQRHDFAESVSGYTETWEARERAQTLRPTPSDAADHPLSTV